MATATERNIKSVHITGVQKRYSPTRHYVYLLRLRWTDRTSYIIYRSYSSFFEFHNELVDRFPVEAGLLSESERTIPKFPRRKFYHHTELHKFVIHYQSSLEEYCRTILKLKTKISRHPFVMAFFELTPDDIDPPEEESKKPDRMSSLLKALVPFWMKKENRSKFPTPDVSSPIETEEYCTIDHYKAEVTGQISFKKGESVRVIEKNPSGWWMVEHNGKQGWAPGSYLEKASTAGEPGDALDQPEINLDGDLYVTLIKYDAQMKDEVGFEAGCTVKVLQKRLDGWWIIKYNREIGFAPAAYLMVYTDEDCVATRLPKTISADVRTPLPSFVQIMVDRQVARRNSTGSFMRVHGAQMNLPIPKRKCSITKDDCPSTERVLKLVRRLSHSREPGLRCNESILAENSAEYNTEKKATPFSTPPIYSGETNPRINIIPPTIDADRSSSAIRSRSVEHIPSVISSSQLNACEDKAQLEACQDNGQVDTCQDNSLLDTCQDKTLLDTCQDKTQQDHCQDKTPEIPDVSCVSATPNDSLVVLTGSVDALSRQDEFADFSINVTPAEISDSLIQVVGNILTTPRQNLYEEFKAANRNNHGKPVGSVKPMGRERVNQRVQKWIQDLAAQNVQAVVTPEISPLNINEASSYVHNKFKDEMSALEEEVMLSLDSSVNLNSQLSEQKSDSAPISDIIHRLMRVADNLQLELNQVMLEKYRSCDAGKVNAENPAVQKSITIPMADLDTIATKYGPVSDTESSGAVSSDLPMASSSSELPNCAQKNLMKFIGKQSNIDEERTYTITVTVKPRK